MTIQQRLKEAVKRRYYGEWGEAPFDNTFAWLNFGFQELMKDSLCANKPQYLWGMLQGAALGKVLGYSKVSGLEFGVAGGFGLLTLEHIAKTIEGLIGIDIEVYGFDSGVGLPNPIDYRDQPNMWFEGQLAMDKRALQERLTKASLCLGPVKETVPEFLRNEAAPVAFISFDLDLYSSTRDALELLLGSYDRLLPRVFSYFDDILGHTYNDFAGERLAISEFNQHNENRKLSPIYGLRHFVPRPFMNLPIWDCLYYAHLFEHPRYCEPDSYNKAMTTDADGHVVRESVILDRTSQVVVKKP